ncbi:cation transporter [Aestuariibaculum sp. M13]|uniref:heavy-metal-associated domain-containing protein n=1 Tax=Aestuariibaculum sp. M13 TaxID=2967132 RepID=UPI002159DBEF|nr:cation transporter [Aestuariibaculum sp. M13]MCR8668667.1 cation transporter [Aestuariibaculum sp. M13]
MKNLLVLITLFVSTMSFAQNKNAKTTLQVNGVCEMCKARIEKACIKTKGVKSANWNVDTHELSLVYNENKTDVKTIKQSVLNAGHDLKDEKAPDEAYNKLHACCKYRDEKVLDAH